MNVKEASTPQDSVQSSNDISTSGTTNATPTVVDDELICRICRETGSRETLVHPCKCSGSIRYVHEKCLLEWIEHSKTETCELCKHKFKFAKVYKSDAPAKLNFWELAIGSLQLGKGTLLKLLRILLVIVVWSFITPTLTAWLLRAFLSRSMLEFVDIPHRSADEIALFQDCLIGAFLTISILVLTIFIAGIKEFVNDILRNLNDQLQQNGALADNNDALLVNQENETDSSGEESDEVIEQLMQPVVERQEPLHQPNDQEPVVQNAEPMQLVFQDEREEDEAVDLEEFIGLKGSVVSLFQNCILIVLMNALYLFCLVFIPFTVGRIIVNLRALFPQITEELSGNDILTKLSITAIGYTFIICFGLVLFIVLLIVQRLFYAKAFATRNISHRTLQIWLYIQTVLKVAFVGSFNFAIIPVCCGTVLNLATADFFGSSVSHRMDLIRVDRPSFIVIHWFVGLAFLFNLSSVIRMLRSILRKGVLWFLNDPDDPNFSYIREAVSVPFPTAVRRISFTIIMFIFLILALVRAPLKLCKSLSPDTFPLSIIFSYPFLQITIDVVMYSILIQVALENIRPQMNLKTLVEKWIRAVSNALDLNEYLFPGDANTDADNNDEDAVVNKPDHFPLRIAGLLLMAWSTATIIIAAVFLVPLLSGRALIAVAPDVISAYLYLSNDLYTHLFGSYVLGSAIFAVLYVTQQIQQQQIFQVLNTVTRYFILGLKLSLLGVLWFTLVPVLLGLAFEMSILIPVLMNDKTALMPISELWAFGVFLSGIAVRFTYLLRNVQALEPWRIEFDRVAANGAQRLEAMRVFMKIVFPSIFWLSMYICLPYLFAKVVTPFFVSSRLEQHKFLVFAYPSLVLLFLLFIVVALIRVCWRRLHDNILDRRYLIRRSLVNLENAHNRQEEMEQPTTPVN